MAFLVFLFFGCFFGFCFLVDFCFGLIWFGFFYFFVLATSYVNVAAVVIHSFDELPGKMLLIYHKKCL